MNNAFDQFYAENIDAFLGKPLDEIAIGVDNQELISRHVPFLLHEMEWQLKKEDAANALQEVIAQGGKPMSVDVSPIDEANLLKDRELCKDLSKMVSEQLDTLAGLPLRYGQPQTGVVFTDANGQQQFKPFAL